MQDKLTVTVGHYADNVDKRFKGTAVVAQIDTGSKVWFKQAHHTDKSYMDGSLQIIREVLAFVRDKAAAVDDPEVTLNLELNLSESNVWKRMSKLASIYSDLKRFDQDVQPLVEIKLLKSNRSKSTTHDVELQIVSLLFAINNLCVFQLYVQKVPPSNSIARTVRQQAEVVGLQSLSSSNVVPFAART